MTYSPPRLLFPSIKMLNRGIPFEISIDWSTLQHEKNKNITLLPFCFTFVLSFAQTVDLRKYLLPVVYYQIRQRSILQIPEWPTNSTYCWKCNMRKPWIRRYGGASSSYLLHCCCWDFYVCLFLEITPPRPRGGTCFWTSGAWSASTGPIPIWWETVRFSHTS